MNNTTLRRNIRRIEGNEFCDLNIELRTDDNGFIELSLTGTCGEIINRAQAKSNALDYWESFFDESPEELRDMGKRLGKRFRSSRAAAKFVLDTDGEFHGLDVIDEQDNKVFICNSCGQIQNEIARFFPEAMPYFKWHLNGLHAGCEHQDELGWSHNDIGNPCPVCGYKWGSAWTKRELPPEVIKWANEFN